MMKKLATLLIPVITLAVSAAKVSATAPTNLPVKTAVAEKLNTSSPNTIYNFAVSDASGVLLTCAKQQIDTDTFSGCTLAPGKTLDDLMTSIVRAIRVEQNKVNGDPK
jgi:hypothetical protein